MYLIWFSSEAEEYCFKTRTKSYTFVLTMRSNGGLLVCNFDDEHITIGRCDEDAAIIMVARDLLCLCWLAALRRGLPASSECSEPPHGGLGYYFSLVSEIVQSINNNLSHCVSQSYHKARQPYQDL